MQIFITGTGTDIGKTIISSYLCLHSNYAYFKPIQTGSNKDSDIIRCLTNSYIYKELFLYAEPVAPYLAAKNCNEEINVANISLPNRQDLIIEGSGGLFVPLNRDSFMIDLIKQMGVSVILVASSMIGTINHSLLSLESLRIRSIPILGIILNGPINHDNEKAIEFYGNVNILASIPFLSQINKASLLQIALGNNLKQILETNNEFKRAR